MTERDSKGRFCKRVESNPKGDFAFSAYAFIVILCLVVGFVGIYTWGYNLGKSEVQPTIYKEGYNAGVSAGIQKENSRVVFEGNFTYDKAYYYGEMVLLVYESKTNPEYHVMVYEGLQ